MFGAIPVVIAFFIACGTFAGAGVCLARWLGTKFPLSPRDTDCNQAVG